MPELHDPTDSPMKQTVDRNAFHGFDLILTQWVGRLGNHLIQLSNAIHVAERTKSRLTIPDHASFKRRIFDFRGDHASTGSKSSCFFWPHECLGHPIEYDAIRRNVFRRHVVKMFLKRERWWWPSKNSSKVGPETLVINIRSGADIFRADPPPQSDYMQPPFSFYRRIIEDHGYTDCLIVTEADRMNPVIDHLLKWDKRIRLNFHRSVIEDIQLVLSARHLVMAHSTFTWCLALMSDRLEVLHQPDSFKINGVPDIDIHSYHLDGYIEPGTWLASEEQFRMMTDHPLENIIHDEAGRDYLPRSAFGKTCDAEQMLAIAEAEAAGKTA
jgi:hypothetical protein